MIYKYKSMKLASMAVVFISVYLGATIVFAHDELGLKPHHIDVPMNPTAVMQAFQDSKAGQIQAVEPAAAAAVTSCSGGMAGQYPCSNID